MKLCYEALLHNDFITPRYEVVMKLVFITTIMKRFITRVRTLLQRHARRCGPRKNAQVSGGDTATCSGAHACARGLAACSAPASTERIPRPLLARRALPPRPNPGVRAHLVDNSFQCIQRTCNRPSRRARLCAFSPSNHQARCAHDHTV